ncbi:MAG: hypothetical protein BWY02_02516 [bacterium ADurb.Bin157]|nr:MAG: hypothetical protein BWY02_02516 [bacterium ADurb.Bin157]
MADNLDINNIHEHLAKKNFIVFAGTGVISGTGIPSTWKELLITLSRQANVNINVDNICKNEYPDVAQKIFDELAKNGEEKRYYEIIKELISAKDSAWDEKPYEILSTTKGVVTTNFDNIFETSYERLVEANSSLPSSIITNSLPDFEDKDDFNKHKIVYLHGRANENHIIFKKNDYMDYYPSMSAGKSRNPDLCLETYLDYIYRKHTIVFVGFSFDDEYVRGCFKGIHRRLTGRDERCFERKTGYIEIIPRIKHYAFIEEVKPQSNEFKRHKEIEAELEEMRIKVIHFQCKREWMDCFQKIRKIRKPNKLENKGE